jgi:beta-glucosidase
MIWCVVAVMGAQVARAADGGANPATAPEPRKDPWWTERHAELNDRAKKGGDVAFIGDSITQGWEAAGKGAWDKFYEPRHAVNLGISGDQTQHVLWRLQNGNLEGFAPKAAVIMIGTNNAPHAEQSAEQIAEGVGAIVTLVREKSPNTKILLLAIFPRGEKPNPQREKIAAINAELAKLDDEGDFVTFLDIGKKFVEKDGSISREVMPDYLHLSPAGYSNWADSIEPTLVNLLAAAAPAPASPAAGAEPAGKPTGS